MGSYFVTVVNYRGKKRFIIFSLFFFFFFFFFCSYDSEAMLQYGVTTLGRGPDFSVIHPDIKKYSEHSEGNIGHYYRHCLSF